FVEFLDARKVVIGGDIRLSTEGIKQATIEGITDAGADVIDIGMTGTEEVYFATADMNADGGIEVTASHNPVNYNGMKMVREESKPISADTGLEDIRKIAEKGVFKPSDSKGQVSEAFDKQAYIQHLMTYIDAGSMKPLKIVFNPGNGSAGPVLDHIEAAFKLAQIPVEFIKLHHEPDGSFPNGVPNPMIIDNRAVTSDMVLAEQADLGIAFDGDFDRCFFFDEKGQFIEGYYLVGLLAKAFLEQDPTTKIVADPRVIWNTKDIVENDFGSQCVISKSGHAFIKEKMREVGNVAYGGEMSAHHYFQSFNYCDSGMIPWLLVIEQIAKTGKSLGELVQERIDAFPSSGEINRTVTDADAVIEAVEKHFSAQATDVLKIDGLSMSFEQWRFNLRKSNTEPLIRLNIESKADKALVEAKKEELLALIESI
ncbi:MAG: phosphomannomutase CpsG, partial [Pseudomonadota bacterium]|nr:phosphomannomutase CpsG [Pseudomonadota bacterium]